MIVAAKEGLPPASLAFGIIANMRKIKQDEAMEQAGQIADCDCDNPSCERKEVAYLIRQAGKDGGAG